MTEKLKKAFIIFLLLIPIVTVLLFLFSRSQASLLASNEALALKVQEDKAIEEENKNKKRVEAISLAKKTALGYDYDRAINILKDSEFSNEEEVLSLISEYENTKASLVRKNPKEITHIFFHSLIYDTKKAFDGDYKEKGYNQTMTTAVEFTRTLESLYERGYVLVKLEDIASEKPDENGNMVWSENDIMLPPDKIPFVMSQDDLCYYDYMAGDGFATKLILNDEGRLVTEMINDDGSISVGSFDLVPMLNDFIEKNPDFSYKGARACIALTGYNGILGYKTAFTYNTEEYKNENPNFNFENEQAEAKKICEALKSDGYELASHGWGHINLGTVSIERFNTDVEKWENEVEILTGKCNIMIFPFGADIGDWRPYSSDNERLNRLMEVGFRYFCNVDSNKYFVQIGDNYLRQGRRNIDGYRLYYDMPESGYDFSHLDDLLDPEFVFDRSRPTPVAKMGE